MPIFRCKMCGGDVEIAPNKTFGTCDYCGSTMTFPKVDDEQRAAAFNRGNHFRRIGEFDKALAVYERILAEDDTDAEAHWCCALCRFGIEYVEDPTTFEYIPTCHRASFDNILEDVDYLSAVEYSEGITRRQYQKDAAKIAEVQRGVLATSQKEEPYDAFICYKETDDTTHERTRDSLDAQEIYYHLTEKGYRVFFSRITLEDKAGAEYEPYIFAALNSAKVMIALGSKPEYFNAVWVKNEWSRFLSLMRKDRSKLLLPCYRGMDPYDLPEQLSILQSYDMGKIGFMQDLFRGIKKIIDAEKKIEPVVQLQAPVTGYAGNISALLKRGNMALEDHEWEKADGYFEEVLNQDAEYAEAYLGKFLAKNKIVSLHDICNKVCFLDENSAFKRAEQFADTELKNKLSVIRDTMALKLERLKLINFLRSLYSKRKKEEIKEQYQLALRLIENAKSTKSTDLSESKKYYKQADNILKTLGGYDNSEKLMMICQREILRIDEVLECTKKIEESKKELDAYKNELRLSQERQKRESAEEEQLNSIDLEIKAKTRELSGMKFFNSSEKKRLRGEIEKLEQQALPLREVALVANTKRNREEYQMQRELEAKIRQEERLLSSLEYRLFSFSRGM